MIVFGAPLSPYVRKVLVFAAEKGVEVESRAPQPGGPPDPDFLAASPFRKIPAFQHGDFHLADSSAIVAYIDKLHPEPALIPADAKGHAKAVWYDEFADTILTAAGVKIFFNRFVAKLMGREGDLDVADKAEKEELPPVYAYLEGVIPASNFLVGDRLTLADISVASPFANLAYLGVRPDPDAYPKLTAYVESVHARPSFASLIAADKAAYFGG